ncbi:hypothetical protein NEF87_002576 [Candidatus Lokiarchaeum ossiferum]|uniref:Uncharacterized protein n=1 Tax=Candidatus Lokiarchaeum ossiferum TaxID=2951803 RepID=A0ABY6HUN7_9ARCH|nr:hypothetical protein NEF87_002576 [Candidatus Lokiarchaeum sp. B-35]
MANPKISRKVYRNLLIFMFCTAIFDLIVGLISGPNYFLILMAGSLIVSSSGISALIIKQSTEILDVTNLGEEQNGI